MTDLVPVPPCVTHPWVTLPGGVRHAFICPRCGMTSPDSRLHTPAQIAQVRDWLDHYLADDSSYPPSQPIAFLLRS